MTLEMRMSLGEGDNSPDPECGPLDRVARGPVLQLPVLRCHKPGQALMSDTSRCASVSDAFERDHPGLWKSLAQLLCQ